MRIEFLWWNIENCHLEDQGEEDKDEAEKRSLKMRLAESCPKSAVLNTRTQLLTERLFMANSVSQL
jgi:hypothetical protein